METISAAVKKTPSSISGRSLGFPVLVRRLVKLSQITDDILSRIIVSFFNNFYPSLKH